MSSWSSFYAFCIEPLEPVTYFFCVSFFPCLFAYIYPLYVSHQPSPKNGSFNGISLEIESNNEKRWGDIFLLLQNPLGSKNPFPRICHLLLTGPPVHWRTWTYRLRPSPNFHVPTLYHAHARTSYVPKLRTPAEEMTSSLTTNLWKPTQLDAARQPHIINDVPVSNRRRLIIIITFVFFFQTHPLPPPPLSSLPHPTSLTNQQHTTYTRVRDPPPSPSLHTPPSLNLI